MKIKTLFGKNKSLVNSCLVYLACFMKLFQTVNRIILGPTGREETAWARTIGLNRGFCSLEPKHPNVQSTGPSNSVNPIPVKLHCQVNISTLHLLTMHAVSPSENVSQAVRVKIKIYSTKVVKYQTSDTGKVVCCIFNFHQLHCFVFYENFNTQFN